MYPQSPTAQQWRAVAADRARAKGVSVPSWFAGSDADVQRLNGSNPEILLQVRNEMQRYVLENPGDFPAAHLEAARKYLGSAAASAALALENYGVLEMAGDFVEEVGNQAADLNDQLNPFSEQNRRILFWGLGLTAAAYFLLPVAIRAFMDAKGGPAAAKSPRASAPAAA